MEDLTNEELKVWGLDILSIGLHGDDYGWDTITELPKKYILTKVNDLVGKVKVMSFVASWQITGHVEWEYLMAGMVLFPVANAVKANQEQTDISNLFNRDLIASRDRRLTRAQIVEKVMPFFNTVGEDDENIYLELRVS